MKAEIYFAITSNTVQFGGRITLDADLEVAEAKAWIGVDALFQWSPRLYFVFLIDAGVEIKALGHTVAGVSFHGELSGMKPWHLEGHAKTTILLWDVPVDIGPIEWGEHDESIAPPVSPANLAAEALALPEAWTPRLPTGAETLARFSEDTTTPLLVHPFGALEVKQLRVPLETEIDRVGSSPVTSRRVHLADPKIGALDAAAVSHATDFFAPGHFINLTQDQQVSRPSFEEFPCGMKVAASRGAIFGAAMSVTHAWETFYPHEKLWPNDCICEMGRGPDESGGGRECGRARSERAGQSCTCRSCRRLIRGHSQSSRWGAFRCGGAMILPRSRARRK